MFTHQFSGLSLRAITTCAIFTVAIVVNVFSQPATAVSNRQTRMIKDVNAIGVTAPPGKEKEREELKILKEQLLKNNEKNLHKIKYWDAGSPSYRWNQLAPTLISFQDFVTFSRAPSAWMNLAIYDATILAWQAKNKYQRMRPAERDATVKAVIKGPATFSYPCEHSVTAAAAARVLAYFYPHKADSILALAREAAQSRVDAGVQFPSDMEAGWKLGEAVAAKIIEQARQDGSDSKWTGSMKTDPRLWRGDYPVGITTATFQPIILQKGDQFRPPPPPDFAEEMKAMKNFKQDAHTVYLAHYWATHSGLDVWTDLASRKLFEYRLQDDALASSQVYTLLHVAFHDAAIAIMDAKYAYWGIRPFQYDSTFKPLIFTPPFPGYPSGHATASSTASTVLEYFFPADAPLFQRTVKECADSRFYGGIHFTSDNTIGIEMGKKLGNYLVAAWMKKE